MGRTGTANSMTLADLKPGMQATIGQVVPDNDGVIRLMVLGLVEGARVMFRHAAIGGDPLEISVHGAAISVRREQAAFFHIAPAATRDD
jgi:Fe2+ transport system protein FeoA